MHFILLLPIQVLFFLQRYNIFIYPPNFSPNINDFFSIRLQTSSLFPFTQKILLFILLLFNNALPLHPNRKTF